jgi:multidrug efflux pump subunit AcrA (membrane-fusion protein)
MTKDKSSRSTDSDAPGTNLTTERDEFLKKFSRGTQLTEDFVKEHERMQSRLQDLESENAGLRAKVEADQAVRELLKKIERLEHEKSELVSQYRQAEAITTEFTARVQEVESEFANLANLFVASNQLHSSLSPRGVTRRIKEVLAQLVGAERYAMYFVNPEGEQLIPIASEIVTKASAGGTREVTIGFRPEDLRIMDQSDGFPLEVDVVESLGADAYVYGHVTTDDGATKDVIVRADGRIPPAKGETIYVGIIPDHLHAFHAVGGERIS